MGAESARTSGGGPGGRGRTPRIDPRAAAARARVEGDDGLRDVVEIAQRSRARRELADLDIRRSIDRLRAEKMSQRDIAELVGLSQAEVSRRLKRRGLGSDEPGPREVILRRQAGEISTKAMLAALRAMGLTAGRPSRDAGFDGGASSTGTAKQLATAFQDGLLSADEYERLRRSVRITHERRPR